MSEKWRIARDGQPERFYIVATEGRGERTIAKIYDEKDAHFIMNLTYDHEMLEEARQQVDDLKQLVLDLRQDVVDRDALIAKYAHDLEAMTALAKRLKAAIDAL